MTKEYMIYGNVTHKHFRVFVKLLADIVGLKGIISNENEFTVKLILSGSEQSQKYLISAIKTYFYHDRIFIEEKLNSKMTNLEYSTFEII